MSSDRNRRIVANYDEVARVSPSDLLATGRHAFCAGWYNRLFGRFLAEALELKATDALLDAGCNTAIYHDGLAPRVRALVGLDASPHAIARAKARNARFANARYEVADLTALEPKTFSHRFNKILCYSVIPFLGDAREAEAVLTTLARLLDGGHGVIFLGEIRDKAMYESFRERLRERRWPTPRDLMFKLTRWINGRLLHEAHVEDGILPTLYAPEDLEAMARRLGGTCERLPEAAWHPYYNVCVDYRLRF